MIDGQSTQSGFELLAHTNNAKPCHGSSRKHKSIKSILKRCLYSVCIYLCSMCATMSCVGETGWPLYRRWALLFPSSDNTCGSFLESMKMPIG